MNNLKAVRGIKCKSLAWFGHEDKGMQGFSVVFIDAFIKLSRDCSEDVQQEHRLSNGVSSSRAYLWVF